MDAKVRLASIHLDGITLQWHLNYMRNRFDVYSTWAQYVADVAARFGEAYEDPLTALIQVKQVGKVQGRGVKTGRPAQPCPALARPDVDALSRKVRLSMYFPEKLELNFCLYF